MPTRCRAGNVFVAGLAAAIVLHGAGLHGAVRQAATPPTGVAAERRALVDRYCVTCHNERRKTAGLTLDTVDLARVAANPEVVEKIVRKLRSGQMPPEGQPRPDDAATARL